MSERREGAPNGHELKGNASERARETAAETRREAMEQLFSLPSRIGAREAVLGALATGVVAFAGGLSVPESVKHEAREVAETHNRTNAVVLKMMSRVAKGDLGSINVEAFEKSLVGLAVSASPEASDLESAVPASMRTTEYKATVEGLTKLTEDNGDVLYVGHDSFGPGWHLMLGVHEQAAADGQTEIRLIGLAQDGNTLDADLAGDGLVVWTGNRASADKEEVRAQLSDIMSGTILNHLASTRGSNKQE